MAEYIDREKANDYMEELLDGRFDATQNTIIQGIRDNIAIMPTANVIEREKIDKAIEEIKEHSIPDYEYHGCGGKQSIIETQDVLDILKKHIGEVE